MKPIETLQEWREVDALSQVHTVSNENANRIIHAYQLHVRNSYVCRTCPSAIWNALQAVKELANANRAHWVAKQAEEDVRDYRRSGDTG